MARRRRKTDSRRRRKQRPVLEADIGTFRRAFERQYPLLGGRGMLIKRLFEPTTSEHLHPLEVLKLQRAAIVKESEKPDLSWKQIDALTEAMSRLDAEVAKAKKPDHPLRRRTP